jgi:hypothetical protein
MRLLFYLLVLFSILYMYLYLRTPYVSPVLRPYVKAYLQDMKANGVDVSDYGRLPYVRLVPSSEQICGTDQAVGCSEGGRVRIMEYLPNDKFTEEQYYRVLVYHELGHALLGMPHTDEVLSIMNTYSDSTLAVIEQRWGYLHHQYVDYAHYMATHAELRVLSLP